MMKKAIAILLVITIGLSMYIGTTVATGEKPNPFNAIIELVLGIDNKIDSLNATQILAYYEGSYQWSTDEPIVLPGTHISADKPVLFTISVSVYSIDGDEYVAIQDPSTPGQEFWVKVWYSTDASQYESLRDTTTFPGTGMKMLVYEFGDYISVFWRVMVQGTPGTVVTVENPA